MTQLSVPSTSAGLHAWLTYLEHLHHQAIDMGLDRVKQVAEQLNLLQPSAKVMTVAGTNGKGSTVRYLETILRVDGYQTGVYISPHLHCYNERVRINGEQLSDAEHVAAFAAVEAARGDISLTYFEFGTLAALWLMQQRNLDVWVLEIGLGGRLDAVNIIDADVALLTSVGIDHVGFLGADRTGIAREKAGIFRPHRPAICGEPDLPAAVVEQAQAQQVQLQRVGYEFFYKPQDAQHWQFRNNEIQLLDLPLPLLPLPNAATAVAALAALPLPVTLTAIKQGLEQARESGRLQFLAASAQRPTDTLLDVAHNPHAAAYLVEVLRQRYPERPVLAVVGMLQDKDIAGTLATLQPLVAQWFFADLSEPRGARAEQLQQQLPSTANVAGCFADVASAYAAALAAATPAPEGSNQQQPLVLVCGSFYTVGKIADTE